MFDHGKFRYSLNLTKHYTFYNKWWSVKFSKGIYEIEIKEKQALLLKDGGILVFLIDLISFSAWRFYGLGYYFYWEFFYNTTEV